MVNVLQNLISQQEQALRDHQEFYDAYSKAAMWLRSTNEKMLACNDARVEKEQLAAKIDKLQVRHCLFVASVNDINNNNNIINIF